MDIKKINHLFEEGTFTELFKAGFVNSKVFEYREIYLWVDMQMKIRKISRYKAALEAEVKFDRSLKTIYVALNTFEQ